MNAIECPGCGTVRNVDRVVRTAGEFCESCDYPLFWAPDVLERQPLKNGTGVVPSYRPGRIEGRLETERCPACTEPNPLGADTCLRCGAEMHPAPPEPEPEPEPVFVPAPEPEPWWKSINPVVVVAVLIAVVVLQLALLLART